MTSILKFRRTDFHLGWDYLIKCLIFYNASRPGANKAIKKDNGYVASMAKHKTVQKSLAYVACTEVEVVETVSDMFPK